MVPPRPILLISGSMVAVTLPRGGNITNAAPVLRAFSPGGGRSAPSFRKSAIDHPELQTRTQTPTGARACATHVSFSELCFQALHGRPGPCSPSRRPNCENKRFHGSTSTPSDLFQGSLILLAVADTAPGCFWGKCPAEHQGSNRTAIINQGWELL